MCSFENRKTVSSINSKCLKCKVGLYAMSDDLKNKSVGSLLRQARLAQKGKLPEISENLRISHVHLRALEEDSVNGVPGLGYAAGFICS